jgi:hypothetical protein
MNATVYIRKATGIIRCHRFPVIIFVTLFPPLGADDDVRGS